MEIMFVTIIILGIAYAIYKLVELFARRNERMSIIEKMSLGDDVMNPIDVNKWFSPPTPASWALRLGLLLIGLGLGLGIAVILNSYMKFTSYSNEAGIMYIALMMLFGGLGLVIAYLIEQKNLKKE